MDCSSLRSASTERTPVGLARTPTSPPRGTDRRATGPLFDAVMLSRRNRVNATDAKWGPPALATWPAPLHLLPASLLAISQRSNSDWRRSSELNLSCSAVDLRASAANRSTCACSAASCSCFSKLTIKLPDCSSRSCVFISVRSFQHRANCPAAGPGSNGGNPEEGSSDCCLSVAMFRLWRANVRRSACTSSAGICARIFFSRCFSNSLSCCSSSTHFFRVSAVACSNSSTCLRSFSNSSSLPFFLSVPDTACACNRATAACARLNCSASVRATPNCRSTFTTSICSLFNSSSTSLSARTTSCSFFSASPLAVGACLSFRSIRSFTA
mmetsp:Transcript_29381/g.57497  ORF Transcript_29381/g.57497 Transcript_29381/m.57497 type:complete len:327 (-) Transcript_29381:1754-2734(-)